MSPEAVTSAAKPIAAPKTKPAAAPVKGQAAPRMAKDKVALGHKAAPAAEVPGEDIRNQVSLTGTVLGPVVTANQTVGMLAKTSFKSPWLAKLAHGAVQTAGFLGKFRVLNNPLVASGLKVVSRALPVVGLGLLSFDGFAAVKTFTNPDASGLRKGLTFGRFFFNAIATGVSFIPGAGFVYSLAPSLVGNCFEIACAKLNAKETAAPAKA